MKRPTLLLGFGVLCLVTFLVTTMPAALLGRLAQTAGVQLVDPTGSFWNGQARAIRAASISLQQTRWQLSPFALLTGQLRAKLDSRMPGGSIHTQLKMRPGGTVVLQDLELTAPLQALSGMIQLPFTEGRLKLQFQRLVLEDQWPVAAVGEAIANGISLGMPGTAAARERAGFKLSFDQPEPAAKLSGTLTDIDGPVELQGTLELSPPRNYTIDARARVRAGASEEIRQGLLLLGAENAQGWREISFAGSL